MPEPFLRPFLPPRTAEEQAERLLDNQYQLELVAEDEAQLIEFLTHFHRSLRTLTVQQVQSAKLPRETTDTLLAFLAGDDAKGEVSASFPPVDLVGEYITRTARTMQAHRATLEEISQTRRKAIEGSGISDLLSEAEHALKSGMLLTGRDQAEEFKDSLKLLKNTQEGVIGSRNYVTWFQAGWLLWRGEKNLPQAEEAFYQASRLSSSQADLYHLYSLRHHAYLQYLQGKHEEALSDIDRALRLTPDDADLHLDAARYAARAGHTETAIEHLDRYLTLEPAGALTLFAETDFAALFTEVATLVKKRADATRATAQDALAQFLESRQAVKEAEKLTGTPLPLPEETQAAVDNAISLVKRLDTLGFASCLGIGRTAKAKSIEVYRSVIEVLERTAVQVEENIARPKMRLERLLADKKKWETEIKRIEREAKMKNFNLNAPPPRFAFRRDPMQDTARVNYAAFKVNLADMERIVNEERPVLEAAIAQGETTKAGIESALIGLRAKAM